MLIPKWWGTDWWNKQRKFGNKRELKKKTLKILHVWPRARGDGHHYDVTSRPCGVTITTRVVEWTLSIYDINVFFCSFPELSSFEKRKWLRSQSVELNQNDMGARYITINSPRSSRWGKNLETGVDGDYLRDKCILLLFSKTARLKM